MITKIEIWENKKGEHYLRIDDRPFRSFQDLKENDLSLYEEVINLLYKRKNIKPLEYYFNIKPFQLFL